MLVMCRQKDVLKIQEGIPGHGLQEAVGQRNGRIYLKCLCSMPLGWLPLAERGRVQTEVPVFKPKYRK